jgi:hypothetical protein
VKHFVVLSFSFIFLLLNLVYFTITVWLNPVQKILLVFSPQT